ncbi:unnamed protein product [Dicrocoelium dendriticum]|nr:unnamed protein product [Dicrocoelium dendriticum]
MVSLTLLLTQWLEDIRGYFYSLFFGSVTDGDPDESFVRSVDKVDNLSVHGLECSRGLNEFPQAQLLSVGHNKDCCAASSGLRTLSHPLFPITQRCFSNDMRPYSPPNCGLESIELSTYPRSTKHHFCPIPLDADIFCDSCNCPIYTLGTGPVCQRCADCHITCHEWCTKSVQVPCNGLFSVNDPPSRGPSKANRFTNGDIGFTSPTESSPALPTPLSDLPISSMTADFPILIDRGHDKQSAISKHPTDTVLPTSGSGNVTQLDSEPSLNGDTDISLGVLDQSEYPVHQESHTILTNTFENGLEPVESPPRDTETLGSASHPTSIGRSNTELGRVRRPCKTNLSVRHSFLAGHGSGATTYSRLSYDFSSLDRKTINDYGIRVRELNLNSSDRSPPSPPQRISSLTPSASLQQSSTPSPDASSEFGLATVMQTTANFIKRKPRRNGNAPFHPAPSPPLAVVVVGPRGKLPYTAEQLLERLRVFNSNEFGLQSRPVPHLPPNDCEGTVRIHINLLRPIHMLLTVRPVSIFDLVGKEDDADGSSSEDALEEEFSWDVHSSSANEKCLDQNSGLLVNGTHFYPPKSAVTANTPSFSADYCVPFNGVKRRLSKRLFGTNPQSATFWLPRGSTKLLSTTAQKVIAALLDRFQLEDNPQKFALYEHTIEGDQQVSVRKLYDNESPLGLFLRWTEEGESKFNQLLCVKRLVLQENETGDIEWNGFSLPELHTFLGILNQEEVEYRRKIELKYELRRKEVLRLIALHERQRQPQTSSVVATSAENSDCGTLPTLCCRGEDSFSDESKVSICARPQLSTDPSRNPMSAAIPPVLRNHSEENPVRLDHCESNDDSTFAPNHNSFGLTVTSAKTSPSHSPERTVNKAANTLPRLLGSDEMGKTLFRPSAYKQMKKADKAEQKRLEKAEKERLKAEKKRLKAEAKLARQHQPDIPPTHSRRLFNLVVLPRTSSPFTPTDSRSTLKR